MIDIKQYYKGKNVIITGGAGSVGSQLLESLTDFDVNIIRIIDINETALFEMEQQYSHFPNVEFYYCDICNETEVFRVFSNMDICFHLASLKHVPSCEKSPLSAVNTNILGSKVVAAAAMHHKLQKVLFSSSDKACNPTNVMGATKLMVERLYTAINFLKNSDTKTAFFSTRFGNVLGSQGSVIPLFCSQIKKGGPVTLTDDRMTRFIMSLKQAAGLLIESMYHAIGGEIFITKMPVVKIIDLARVVIDTQAALYSFGASDIKLKIIGPRPGEKLWEELSTDEEARRIFETDKYLIVTPALISNSSEIYDYKYLKLEPVNTTYHSSKLPSLDLCQIQNYLLENHIISNKLC